MVPARAMTIMEKAGKHFSRSPDLTNMYEADGRGS